MKTEIEDMTFDELVDYATQRAHSALLKGGGDAMKSEIWLLLDIAIRWNKSQNLTKIQFTKNPDKPKILK